MVDKSKLFDVDVDDDEMEEEDEWAEFRKEGRATKRPKKESKTAAEPEKSKRGRGRPKKLTTRQTEAKTVHLYVNQMTKLSLESKRWQLEYEKDEHTEALNNSAIIRVLLDVFEPVFKNFEGIENEEHLRQEILKIMNS